MELNKIPKLIGISGRMNSGKDAVGNMIRYLTDPQTSSDLDYYMTALELGEIASTSSYKIKKYADPLKQICADLLGVSKSAFEDRDYKESELSSNWSTFKYKNDNSYSRIFPTEIEAKIFAKEQSANSGKMPLMWNITENKMTPRKLLQLMGTDAGRNNVHDNIWVNAVFANWHSNGKQRWIFTDVRFPNEVRGIHARGGIVINVRRNHVPRCISNIDVSNHIRDLHMEYSDGEMFPIDFIRNKISFNSMTPIQKIQEGIDIFLYESGTEEHFKYIQPHESETALDDYPFHNIIENGWDFTNLKESVGEILIKNKL